MKMFFLCVEDFSICLIKVLFLCFKYNTHMCMCEPVYTHFLPYPEKIGEQQRTSKILWCGAGLLCKKLLLFPLLKTVNFIFPYFVIHIQVNYIFSLYLLNQMDIGLFNSLIEIFIFTPQFSICTVAKHL